MLLTYEFSFNNKLTLSSSIPRAASVSWLGWVTYCSSRLIQVGLGNLRFLQAKAYLIPRSSRSVNIWLHINIK
jgi:hypothetical protein